MPSYYMIEQGSRLSVEHQRLLVQKEGSCLAQIPLLHLGALHIYGNVGVTTPALKRLLAAGIDLVFFTQHGRFQGRLVGAPSRDGDLRRHQYQFVHHLPYQLATAQQIVAGKIANMRAFLRRHSLPTPAVQLALQELPALRARCFSAAQNATLLGLEGRASALYFRAWHDLFKHEWGFSARRRRPPTDPVNVLLSFAYTLLTQALESAVLAVGLDPYLGVLHSTEYGRPSLALDLVEEFRTPVVDSLVLWLLNSEVIRAQDFHPPAPDDERGYPLVLSQEGKRRLIAAYEQRLDDTVKHPVTGETLPYRRIFELQTRFLARTFRDNRPYIPFQMS